MVASAAGRTSAQALSFARVAAQGLGAREPRRPGAGRGRPFCRARRPRPRPRPGQPDRHRDRGGARLRHRPSRHHARLPARARWALQVAAPRASRSARPRSRHRQRRPRHRRRPRAAPPRAGDRHRRQRRPRRARQRPPQPRGRDGGGREGRRRHGRSIRQRAPFDLVFANILLGPLQRIAAPLKRLVAAGGRVVVSGLLPAQANAAMAAYRPLVLERRIDLDGWTTLVLAHRTRRRGTSI